MRSRRLSSRCNRGPASSIPGNFAVAVMPAAYHTTPGRSSADGKALSDIREYLERQCTHPCAEFVATTPTDDTADNWPSSRGRDQRPKILAAAGLSTSTTLDQEAQNPAGIRGSGITHRVWEVAMLSALSRH